MRDASSPRDQVGSSAARDIGIPFGGHVSDAVGLPYALASGQVSIDHLDNYIQALVQDAARPAVPVGMFGIGTLLDRVDELLLPELVQATIDADAWVVPMMVVLWETAFFLDRTAAQVLLECPEVKFMPQETVTGWVRRVYERLTSTDADTNRHVAALRRRVLQALHAGGANIALGTDSPQVFSVPGFAVHHEMAFYVDIGMTPYAVLQIGTRKPAKCFDKADEFGSVAVGHRADLILLTENPLDDIAHAAGVMVNGRWLPEEEIQRRQTEIAQFYGN